MTSSNCIHLLLSSSLAYGVPLHETVHLQCNVDANPAHVSFYWRFHDKSESLFYDQINDTR